MDRKAIETTILSSLSHQSKLIPLITALVPAAKYTHFCSGKHNRFFPSLFRPANYFHNIIIARLGRQIKMNVQPINCDNINKSTTLIIPKSSPSVKGPNIGEAYDIERLSFHPKDDTGAMIQNTWSSSSYSGNSTSSGGSSNNQKARRTTRRSAWRREVSFKK
jgi:hypothetical protein